MYPEKAKARRIEVSSTRLLDSSRGSDLRSYRVIYGILPQTATRSTDRSPRFPGLPLTKGQWSARVPNRRLWCAHSTRRPRRAPACPDGKVTSGIAQSQKAVSGCGLKNVPGGPSYGVAYRGPEYAPGTSLAGGRTTPPPGPVAISEGGKG